MMRAAAVPGGIFHGWWLVGLGFLLQGIVTAAVSYSYGIVLAPLVAEFSASRLDMMLGITASTLVVGLASPFLGVAIDRHPLRVLASAGVLLLALGFVLLSLARSMWHVTAVYATCMPLAVALMGPTLVSSTLARWFMRRRGIAMGVAALGTSVCGFVLPPLLQWGIDDWGARGTYRLFAVVVAVVMLPLVWRFLEDSPASRGLAPDGDPVHAGAKAAIVPLPAAGSTIEITRQRNFWAVALVIGVLFSIYSALLSNIAPLATGRGATADNAAYLISSVAVFGFIGKLLFGILADRVDLRFGLAAALLLMILALLLLVQGSNLWLLFAASAALGLAAGGMLPVWGALMAVLFGAANYGRVMGLMYPVMMPVMVAGSPFAGWIHDATGEYALAFHVFVGMCIIALLVLFLVRMPKAQAEESLRNR